jgi:Ca-activated chloride channel family protein
MIKRFTELAASTQRVLRGTSERNLTLLQARLSALEVNSCLLIFVALAAFVLTPFVAVAQASQPSQEGSDDAYTLRLNANMVILSATVLDRRNALVSGLSKDDFRIYENGILQQIKDFSHEDIPVTVGILVDNSGSMAPKRDDVIAAALAFARSSNPQDQMFVVNFNDDVWFGLPADIPFTDRREQLQGALSAIRTIGQTSLYDGIVAGLDHLKQGNRDKKVLILITDGGDTASKHNLGEVVDLAQQSAAVIYAIGIFDEQDGDQNPAVLKRLAKEAGGEAFFPQSSRDITAICEGIARDIRNQYTLTYIPKIASPDGRYRTIVARASSHDRGHVSVRTRAGYLVPLAAPPSPAEAPQR